MWFEFSELLSLAKCMVVRVIGKSGRRAAALQIASSPYYAGLSIKEISRGAERTLCPWGDQLEINDQRFERPGQVFILPPRTMQCGKLIR
jgi:hypothetical protein